MDHPREIILVRHGETRNNVAPRDGRFFASTRVARRVATVPDHTVTLNQPGRRQAREVGQALAKLGEFDVAFHSPYERAKETLACILREFPASIRQRIRLEEHLDLREREQGYLFPMSRQEVESFFPWYLGYSTFEGKFYERPVGGESMLDVCGRIRNFYRALCRFHNGERVLVVTHGRVILAFRQRLERLTGQAMDDLLCQPDPVANGAILRYCYNSEQRRFVRTSLDRAVPLRKGLAEKDGKTERHRR